jgi:hypothetical protein
LDPTLGDALQAKPGRLHVIATSRLNFTRQHPTVGPFLTLPVGR